MPTTPPLRVQCSVAFWLGLGLGLGFSVRVRIRVQVRVRVRALTWMAFRVLLSLDSSS